MSENPIRPTPPSDAGTSEGETPYPPCAYCGGSPWEHEAATTGRTICRQYRSRIVDGAAAPAAEGPRDAAHPGAEAGTPLDDYVEIALSGDAGRLHAQLQAMLNDLTPPSNDNTPMRKLQRKAIHAMFAALTSEVRALREERDALEKTNLDVVNAAMTEVAVLREDKARLDWLDGMARLHEKPVFDVSSRLDGERFTVEFLGRHRYDWFHAPTLREAIDAARLASPSPTGAE